jgi:acyl transferase domain-containing protein
MWYRLKQVHLADGGGEIDGTIIYPAAGMIVMALEASRQLADENRQIAGYCIKDITFHHPLIVSREPEGVEIELYVRSVRDSIEKDCALSDFRVCVYENGHWNENCRGIVVVEYEADKTEVDAGKEATMLRSHHRQIFEQGTKDCKRKVDEKNMYEHLRDYGIEYGPAFRRLQQISCTENGEATAEVTVFKWSPDENANHPQAHIIHPSTLDGVAQLMLVALSKGGDEDIPATIPTRIGKLWLSSTGISYPTSAAVNVFARATFTGNRKAESSMSVMNQTTGELMLLMEDVEGTSVATLDADSKNQEHKRDFCYNFDWRPDMDMLDHQAALTYCERARPQRVSPTQFYEELGFVLLMFMSNALDALVGRDLDFSKSHLHRYIQWMKHKVGRFDAGKLPNLSKADPKWALIVQDKEYREALCNRLESTNFQGKLYVKVGRNLLKIVTGELDPLSFMFQDNSVPDYYREVNAEVICFQPFVRYLEAMAHKNPGLKILEIGAGVGSTTGYILNTLAPFGEDQRGTPRYSRYDYTDISPAFFENAKDLYKSHNSRMNFKALDIEADPSQQGFEAGAYDLIIAGSVGFLSSIYREALNLSVIGASRYQKFGSYAAKCPLSPQGVSFASTPTTDRDDKVLTLNSGGKLALYEITQDVTRSGFAFGLLPGWWLSMSQVLFMFCGTNLVSKAMRIIGNGAPASRHRSGMSFCARLGSPARISLYRTFRTLPVTR